MKEFSVYDDDDDSGNCQNDSQIILVQKVLSVMDDELILAFYHQFFYTWLYVIVKMKNNNIGEFISEIISRSFLKIVKSHFSY